MSISLIQELKRKYEEMYRHTLQQEMIKRESNIRETFESMTLDEINALSTKKEVAIYLTEYYGYPRRLDNAYIDITIRVPYKALSVSFKAEWGSMVKRFYDIDHQLNDWEINALNAKAAKQDIPRFIPK